MDVGQHARYADRSASQLSHVAALVVRFFTGLVLLAVTAGSGLIPVLFLSAHLGGGIGCAVSMIALVLLVMAVKRFPNTPGTALIEAVVGKLIVVLTIFAPIGILEGLIGSDDGAAVGLLLGLALLVGIAVYGRSRARRTGNKHESSPGYAAWAGTAGATAVARAVATAAEAADPAGSALLSRLANKANPPRRPLAAAVQGLLVGAVDHPRCTQQVPGGD